MSLTLLFSGSACLALETVHLLLLAAHVQADILQWPDHQQEELQEGCPVCRGGHQPQCLEVLPLRHAGGLSRGHRDQCSLDNAFISLECLCKIEDWQSQSLWLWCVILPNILPNQHFENFWEFPFWIMILDLKQTFLTGSFSLAICHLRQFPFPKTNALRRQPPLPLKYNMRVRTTCDWLMRWMLRSDWSRKGADSLSGLPWYLWGTSVHFFICT